MEACQQPGISNPSCNAGLQYKTTQMTHSAITVLSTTLTTPSPPFPKSTKLSVSNHALLLSPLRASRGGASLRLRALEALEEREGAEAAAAKEAETKAALAKVEEALVQAGGTHQSYLKS